MSQTSVNLKGKVQDTTDSSSTTTGALTVAGGVGIAKKLFIGDDITGTKAAFTLTGGTTGFTIQPGATNIDLSLVPSGTGRVAVNADPTSALHVSTKQYTDQKSGTTNLSFAVNGLPYTSVTVSTTFTSVAQFVFSGSTVIGTPTIAKLMYALTTGSRTCTARVYDLTNAQTIATVALGTSPVALNIISMGAISNIPTGEAQFAIQVNRDATGAGNTAFRLYSFKMY